MGVLRGWGRAQITVVILGREAKKVEKHWSIGCIRTTDTKKGPLDKSVISPMLTSMKSTLQYPTLILWIGYIISTCSSVVLSIVKQLSCLSSLV